jgi:D-beta-D-heptose 7-phosphate kinase/D-beta-D-heptose 1-phosphate adenosyltransferase
MAVGNRFLTTRFINILDNKLQILEKFSEVKVLVVGDVMLDRYWWGKVNRISPEAPVPVLNLTRQTSTAGGAANVAVNIAGLGAEPLLVGVVGEDEGGREMPQLLEFAGVSADYLISVKKRPTTIKTRIVAHHQHIVRVDHENAALLEQREENLVWKKLEKVLDLANVILISDYAKGLLTESILSRLITAANEQGISVLVDPKGKDYQRYTGATLLTPNRGEAAQATGLEPDSQNLVEKAGQKLLENLAINSVLITQGEDGMTLFERGQNPYHLSSLARQVFDVTGAGDTVIATLATALASGANLRGAAALANVAAGLVVEQIGTTSITLDNLKNHLQEFYQITLAS